MAVRVGTPLKQIEFRLSGRLVPNARRVALAASFNQWVTGAHELRKGSDGDWSLVITLPSGTYSYLYCVDGVWFNDPNDDGRQPSEWGQEYSLKVVR